MRHIDLTGNYACDANGDCFISGWETTYLEDSIWKQPSENTCWGFAMALAIKITADDSITPDAYVSKFPLSRSQRLGGYTEKGMGVPLLLLQNSKDRYPGNYRVERQTYTRAKLTENLKNDSPTVLQIPLPLFDFGHDILAVGMRGDSFLFFTWGELYTEERLVSYFNEQYGYYLESFDDLMAYSVDSFLWPNSMLKVSPVFTNWINNPIGGGGNWMNRNFTELQ